MAYFRAGGGGIPASLKSGMNDVLNKKFGTSTTYPPSDWPSDVNLMGPLPVKTASGAIASFSDGADGVPVKSCVVSFVPSGGGGTPSSPVDITGVSGVSVTRTGKNLFDDSVLSDASSTAKYLNLTFKAGTTLTMSSKIPLTSGSACLFFLLEGESIGTSINGVYLNKSRTITVPSSGIVVVAYRTYGSISDLTGYDTQIEYGSTSTSYSPYFTPSVVTDTFGQTIYGGERDLTTDRMSVTWGYIASYNGETLTGRWVSSMDTYVAGTTPTIGAEVAYELATPTEVTGLTAHEINTMLGDNNFYADIGNTSVEYRADISLALNQ